MKYYIFKVQDSAKKTYYVINNMYLGYLGFDSDQIRSLIEYHAGITRKYQLYCKGEVDEIKSAMIHKIFCSDVRLSYDQACQLRKHYGLKLSRNKHWYKIVYPDKNSSASELHRVRPGKNNLVFSE